MLTMIDKLLKFLSEDNGNLSTIRLLTVVWFLIVLMAWVLLSFYKGEFLNIPESIITILSLLVAGKVIQKFGEEKNN